MLPSSVHDQMKFSTIVFVEHYNKKAQVIQGKLMCQFCYECSLSNLWVYHWVLSFCLSGIASEHFKAKGAGLLTFDECEKRLSGLSSFAGRLQMTNAVFSALPTFYMCTLGIPKSLIKKIDKYKKHCLWRGAGINARNPPKAA